MNLDPVVYWMNEREMIRVRKERDEPPEHWTDDKILSTYRFCNVRREDDRVTIWIKESIREPFANHPLLWLMLCIARQINWPATLQELIETKGAWPSHLDFRPATLGRALDKRSKRGDKVYTGAYMIRAESDRMKPWFTWTKQKYMAQIVIGRPWAKRKDFRAETLEQVHGWLMQFTGWGPFMSYQAVVDMRFTALLTNASDRAAWAAAGPGTIRGLNRIHKRPVKQPLAQAAALIELRELAEMLGNAVEFDFDFSDVPNVCCEYDKYMRVKLGEGRPRSLYIPGRGS